MAELFSSPGVLDVFGGVVTLYCLAAAASRFPRCSCFWRMSDEWLMMSATAGQLACSSILLWFSDIWLRAPTTSNHQQELLGKLQQFLEVMITDFLDMNGSSKPSVVRLPKRGGHKVDTRWTQGGHKSQPLEVVEVCQWRGQSTGLWNPEGNFCGRVWVQ